MCRKAGLRMACMGYCLRRYCRKCVLVVSLLVMSFLLWIWFRNPVLASDSKAFKPDLNYLGTEYISWPANGKTVGSQARGNTFIGIIRMDNGVLILDNAKKRKIWEDGVVRPGAGTEEDMRDTEEAQGQRKSEQGKFTISKKRSTVPMYPFSEKSLANGGTNDEMTTQAKTFTDEIPKFLTSSPNKYNISKILSKDIERTPSTLHHKKHNFRTATEKVKTTGKQSLNNENEGQLVEGYLSMHTWFDICLSSINSLRNFLLFPIAANTRSYTRTLDLSLNRTNYGQRLFGYIRPPSDGNYSFCIRSLGSAELRLSADGDPKNMRSIARLGDISPGTKKKKSKQSNKSFSKLIQLKAGKLYYIEILHKHGLRSQDCIQVAWRNSSMNGFSQIKSSFLVAIKDDSVTTKKYQYSDIHRRSFANDDRVSSKESLFRNMSTRRLPNDEYLQDLVSDRVLQECEYNPSYLIRHKLVRFQGARNKSNTRFVGIYPPDSTNESLAVVEGEWWKENTIGNTLLDDRIARSVANTFMESLKKKYPREYAMQVLVSVSSTEDKRKGVRFLLNLKLHEKSSNSTKIFTRHVFREKSETGLCFPKKFRWNPNAIVHVIVPVKDSSPWLLAFVKNMEDILTSSNNQKINVVIVDYGSEDVDVEQLLKLSAIERFQVVSVSRSRPFNRAEALQTAANAVKDHHGILFFCDLHLSIPRNLFTLIRQHCIEGKMAFAPVVKRLRCGYYPSTPFGYWETLGFGLFAIYKSDFDRIGGMDVHTFKHWGGEDWELLDRVLMAGIEVERLKVPAFYHFYHPPLGSSNQRNDA